jgi:hypothetical protein
VDAGFAIHVQIATKRPPPACNVSSFVSRHAAADATHACVHCAHGMLASMASSTSYTPVNEKNLHSTTATTSQCRHARTSGHRQHGSSMHDRQRQPLLEHSRQWHGDRHIDAHHAHVNLRLEPAACNNTATMSRSGSESDPLGSCAGMICLLLSLLEKSSCMSQRA